ncbi:MAG: hypothetical protein KAS53_02870 [Candidatus Cloacimonetes bacterium]|nr:hypothetical protein [Candidatus Cloacimonadota bacterium]
MKKLILMLIIISISILFAEELTHSIGMSAGYISGSGISYRQMNERFGYQIAGGTYYEYYVADEDSLSDEEYLGWNISGTFYYNLKNWQTSRFYLLAGTAIFDIYDKEYIEDTDSDYEVNDETYINIGIGIGLEFPLTKYLHMSVEWPWYYDGKLEFLKFIPQAGVHYYFN